MRRRIFIAINLPEDAKRKLKEYQDKIEELFTPYRAKGSGSGPARWTKENNLHITLLFLGYVPDETLPEICKITEEAASRNSVFSLNLSKICYGPPGKMPPRMIWAVGEKSEELGKLQKDLENSLLSAGSNGLKPDVRPCAPHITLGRIRLWEFRRIEPEERPEVTEEVSLNFDVSSIEIMESQLKRGGPEYTILESCPLKK